MIKKKAIIYLLPNGFYYYGEQFPNAVSVGFPQTIIRDLEIASQEKLNELIVAFVKTYNLPPASILIILSPEVLFEKDFAKQTVSIGQEKTEEMEHFLELVPFEETLSRVFSFDQGARVVAANKLFLEQMGLSFQNIEFTIEGAVPYFATGYNSSQLGEFSLPIAQSLLVKFEMLRQETLYTQQKPTFTYRQEVKVSKGNTEKSTSNKRLFVLVGIFVFLLIMLGVSYFALGVSSDEQIKSETPQVVTNVQASYISVSPAKPLATSSGQINNSLRIGVVSNADTLQQAEKLKIDFKKVGYTDFQIEEDQNIFSLKTSVIFSADVPFSTRESILKIVGKTDPNILVQETEERNLLVVIILNSSIANNKKLE